MAREKSSGGRSNRGSESKGKKTDSKKSGWIKPDGTPLRKRKGEYFPDAEIEKKKPGGRGKSDRYNSDKREERGDRRERDDRSSNRTDERRPFEKKRSYAGKDYEPREKRSDDRGEQRGDDGFEKKPFSRSRDSRSDWKEKRSDGFGRSSGNERYSEKSRDSKPDWKEKRGEDETRSKDRGRFSEKRDDGNRSSDREQKSNSRYGREAGRSNDSRRSSSDTSNDRGDFRSGKKPFEKKRERYADKDHSKEMRGRFDKEKPKKYAGPHRERKKSSDASDDGSAEIRLNRYIANAGICSRREADDLITAGVISINDVVVTELGTKVKPDDVVKFNDQTLKTEKTVYVLLNKPKDYITTTDDPQERKTVMSLIKDAGRERIFPVGRLDRNTTGLLMITNDGELTKKLTHPSTNIKKLYQVELDRSLTQADLIQAAEGVELEDGFAGFDQIQYVQGEDKNIIGVELHSGKNRIVRRIFEALGYEVRKLDRTMFAGLTKKDLPRGRWRFLTEMEVNMLKMLTGKKK